MSEWTPQAQNVREDAAEVAAREARHQVLIELLAAYADRELPPETTSQIDAHLVGCERCRRELAIHNTVRLRLEAEPVAAAPSAFRDRVVAAIAATPAPEPKPVPAARRGIRAYYLPAIGLLLAALAVTGIVLRTRASARSVSVLAAPAASVPLLNGVLADYRRVIAGNLPGRARDLAAVRAALPFPVEALRSQAVSLVAAWTTNIDDEPAAVLAYRLDDRIVLEYLVPEEGFFENPLVRQAVIDGRPLAARDGTQSMVAWPTNAAGVVLVGDIPRERLAALAGDDILARRGSRGTQ